jgi:hypothetical protein
LCYGTGCSIAGGGGKFSVVKLFLKKSLAKKLGILSEFEFLGPFSKKRGALSQKA